MPKIPDFSKFDLQGIVNSVKSILGTEAGTPNVTEGDPIGSKMVQISTLLQKVADTQAKSAKDLTQVNNLINELYKDLEVFRKLEAELRQQQAQAARTTASTTASQETGAYTSSTGQTVPPGTRTTGASEESTTVSHKTQTSRDDKVESSTISDAEVKAEEEKIKKKDQSPLDPAEGTSTPSTRE